MSECKSNGMVHVCDAKNVQHGSEASRCATAGAGAMSGIWRWCMPLDGPVKTVGVGRCAGLRETGV